MATDPRLSSENLINTRRDSDPMTDTERLAADQDRDRRNNPDSNPDPITGAPGSHPVGVGIGAAVGGAGSAAIGAAIGTAIVPGIGTTVGAIAGAVIGAFGGGEAGHEIAESIDPSAEDAYWRANYKTRPYISTSEPFDDYAPAYRYGWESRGQLSGRNYDEVQDQLASKWNSVRGSSKLEWDKANLAARDAWEHASHATPRKNTP